MPSLYLILIMFETIADPPSSGALHLTTRLRPEMSVVGGRGLFGT